MAILILVICVALFILIKILDCFDELGWLPMTLMTIALIIIGVNVCMIHKCKYVIPAQIAMYEEENALIEEKVSNTVTKYMEYEKGIVIEVSPDDDAFTLVSLYPELGSDVLVSNEIEIYVSNNPDDRHLQGFTDADFMLSLSAKQFQVGIKHHDDECIKQNPSPHGHTDYFHNGCKGTKK